jgi:hypothetical protein
MHSEQLGPLLNFPWRPQLLAAGSSAWSSGFKRCCAEIAARKQSNMFAAQVNRGRIASCGIMAGDTAASGA